MQNFLMKTIIPQLKTIKVVRAQTPCSVYRQIFVRKRKKDETKRTILIDGYEMVGMYNCMTTEFRRVLESHAYFTNLKQNVYWDPLCQQYWISTISQCKSVTMYDDMDMHDYAITLIWRRGWPKLLQM